MSKAADLARTASASETALSNRNIVINGAMQVAQRGTSVASTVGDTYLTVDRFVFNNGGGATAGRFTSKQTADGPSGFANCLEVDVTTADTSIAAGEHMLIGYRFEGQDLQQLKKGTSDAEQFTVSFYVKGNANATYVCEFFDRDNTRLIQNQFSVTSSWSRVVISFAADTTGAFDDDTAQSMDMAIWLHAGSTFSSGTYTANTWAGHVNANRAVGINSIYTSTDNYFRMTGLQLEVGPVATPFEHRSYGQELALCQRYYYNYVSGNLKSVFAAAAILANYITAVITFPVTMRAAPSAVIASGTGYYAEYSQGETAFSDFTGERLDVNSATLSKNAGGVSITAGDSTIVYTKNASSSISFDAEL